MRIAYAAFEAFPNRKGAGARMRQMLGALAEAGHEVHLLTLPPRSPEPLPAGVVHHPLVAGADNYLERALVFRSQVARRLRTLAPDVVHVRGVFEGEAAAVQADRTGCPFVFEVNGLPSVELRYHYRAVGEAQAFEARLRALEARLLGRADRVITQSRTTLAFLHHRGLPRDTDARVIPNGADPARWALPPAPPSDRLRVLYAGTLAAWQGVAELLMAIRRVARERPVELRLAGHLARARRRQVERLLRRLKLSDGVALLGPLGPDALTAEVAAAHVCAAPLRRDLRNRVQGCSPIKLYEYMAASRAIVSTDLPCVREIVEPEVTARLIRAPQPKRLAEVLLELCAAPEQRARLGEAARAEVIARATWAHRRQALVDLYADFTAGTSPRPPTPPGPPPGPAVATRS
ncbi:MAG: glycosyltransferase family 4 protein [Polyangiaceae bacterium]